MEFKLPRLGEGADSGTIATIFVKEGDEVTKDQPLLELESEKAVATIPSPQAGTVQKIHVREGDEIRVGQLLMTIGGDGASPKGTKAEKKVQAIEEPPQEQDVAPESGLQERPERDEGSDQDREGRLSPHVPGIPRPAAPSIRKLARELGIDLARVKGSERGGRIVMSDLKRYVKQLQQSATQEPPAGRAQVQRAATERPSVPQVDFAKWGHVERKKASKLRTTIGSRMTASWLSVPRVTQFDDVDITDVMALKKKYDKRFEKKGTRLTVTAFALKALVNVLKEHPLLNASLDEETGEIVYKSYYHIGIAVDTEQGLIVPVLRDVDKLSLREIAEQLAELAERTRKREVSLEEMQGGSFTVSNQGGIGSRHFTPIVNVPESAILGMGRGAEQAVVRNSRITKRLMLPVTLSYDHRLVDGANAARFMVDFVRALEKFPEKDVKAGL